MSRSQFHRWRPLTVLAVMLALALPVSPVARAESSTERAKAHYKKGVLHYNLNEFRDSLEEFKRGYREKDDPIFLYNIAQCFRQLGDSGEAVRFYKNYLRAAPKAANRAEVERRIEDLEKAMSVAASARTAPPTDLAPPATMGLADPPRGQPTPGPAAAQTDRTVGLKPGGNGVSQAGPAPPVVNPTAPSPQPPDTDQPAVLVGSPAPDASITSASTPGPTRPLHKQWWLWTAVGAVVLGGVVTAVALSGGGSTPTAQTDFGTFRPVFR